MAPPHFDGIPLPAGLRTGPVILIDEVWTCSPAPPKTSPGWRTRRTAKGGGCVLVGQCTTGRLSVPRRARGAQTGSCSPRPRSSPGSSSLRPLGRVSGSAPGPRSASLRDSWRSADGLGTLPSNGEITIGGGLAIGMHGASLPASGESRAAGRSYGSLSNMVLSFTAVVWSRRRRRYVLRTFQRGDADAKAFLVHLGRAFITDVTLRVGEARNLRCISDVSIATTNFSGPAGSPGRTFQSVIEESGRAEAIRSPSPRSRGSRCGRIRLCGQPGRAPSASHTTRVLGQPSRRSHRPFRRARTGVMVRSRRPSVASSMR